ncbi:uncharacterized protein N7498_009532 [Penicillium cinerascens]|uniref:Uncharacterized protein n=1 Tax=Penicillium cinerascens TaxID=70096 RepID=A0A9W9J628_9EURO|nr:uncharacterized protein N7498_009532 [Penicillium cinerascens]KAJ5190547.1 hypothetical protein N7498_009532 [Penicillium cinerascens]
MKASFVALIAAATAAIAAPTPVAAPAVLSDLTDLSQLSSIGGLVNDLHLGDVTQELNLDNLPKVSSLGDLTKVLNLPESAIQGKSGMTPIIQNGKIVQDLGPELQNILVITGPNVGTLLIELSPEVTALVSGLGLGALGVPLGGIVASASGLGGLVTGLGPYVNGLVTVLGADVGALLVGLSPEVAGLVSGLGLPTVGVPVGTVIATVGTSLKRGEIVQDITPEVGSTLRVTGTNAEELLVKLSPSVASLVSGLGLPTVGVPLGAVVATAGQGTGKLLNDVSAPVEQLLTVTGNDGQDLLVKLSPEVASLVSGLGLPSVGVPAGTVVATIGQNL